MPSPRRTAQSFPVDPPSGSAWLSRPWLRREWLAQRTQVPDAPEIRRVKMVGYLLALLVAAPGLTLVLLEVLCRGALAAAIPHGLVMGGAVALFVYVSRDPQRMNRAEQVFAGLLTLSAVSFLVAYAQHPGVALDHDLLGRVMLFIVAGLLLVLRPQVSIPVSLALMVMYWAEELLLSGADRRSLSLSQWVDAGMLALLMVGVVMRQTLTQLTARMSLLEELTVRDALTGLLNRRGFEERSQALRTAGHSGALLVLDIDDFKAVNDQFGHAAGDHLLSTLADVLVEHLDTNSLKCRWGGEEFMVYLPGSDLHRAQQLAEHLRQAVDQANVEPHITVSLGVTPWLPQEDLHAAYLRADEAMYAAKKMGKNRVSTVAALN